METETLGALIETIATAASRAAGGALAAQIDVETVGAPPEVDFSTLALFTRATLVVQLTMISLVLASFWSWSVIISKFLAFRRVRREIAMFEDAFWSGQPLDALFDRVGTKPRSAIERVFSAGMGEWRRSFDKAGAIIPGADGRIERSLDVALQREGDGFSGGLGVLATTGAIAPFVGLFGTVWGIKNAFEEIAIQQNTSLAVVAPGIAEALVATAIGLVAAIPAVIFYNKLLADAERLGARLETFADEFAVILSRQIMKGAR